MTRTLAIITAALLTVWIPSQAARLGADHGPAARIEPAAPTHGQLLQNRFSGIALR